MKIIKSFLPIIICLCSTMELHAQNATTETAKPLEPKLPAALAPSPMPQSKPQPGSTTSQEATATTSSSSKPESEEKSKPAEAPKANLITRDPGADKKSLTQEQQDILNGKKERPKEPVVLTPNTADPNTIRKPLPKTAAKQQQQQ